MAYHEHLNIIYMRDNGPRRSIRMRRNSCLLLLFFFACLPFVCAALGIQCWRLWEENRGLALNIERFEADYQTAMQRAERLEKFESLLLEESVEAREGVLRKLADSAPSAQSGGDEGPTLEEGPGHEEFPAIETGRVKVDNVQIRILSGNRIRVALDLRNPENEGLLSGLVKATLVTARGEKYDLVFTPADIATFRINRFKRSVMISKIPARYRLANSEMIIEVSGDGGSVLYRNIFSVQG